MSEDRAYDFRWNDQTRYGDFTSIRVIDLRGIGQERWAKKKGKWGSLNGHGKNISRCHCEELSATIMKGKDSAKEGKNNDACD